MNMYKVVSKHKRSGSVTTNFMRLENIRALAEHLNRYVIRFPYETVVSVWLVNQHNHTVIREVSFLEKELKEQKFIVEYKDRFLAVVHRQYDLRKKRQEELDETFRFREGHDIYD